MRLDFQLKALGHWSHLYSRSSVWTIMCCPRLDKERHKRVSHINNPTIVPFATWSVTLTRCVSSPVLIWEDLLTVFALVDGLVAVLALLLEVFSQRVKDGACAGARILLVPPQLQSRGEQLVAVFAAIHLFICEHKKGLKMLNLFAGRQLVQTQRRAEPSVSCKRTGSRQEQNKQRRLALK